MSLVDLQTVSKQEAPVVREELVKYVQFSGQEMLMIECFHVVQLDQS